MPQFETVKAFIIQHAAQWVVALIILLIGVLASKLSRRWLKSILDRSRVREDLLLKNFFLRSVSVAIVITAVLIALEEVRCARNFACRWPWHHRPDHRICPEGHAFELRFRTALVDLPPISRR